MDPCTIQIIDGEGNFKVDHLNSFVAKTRLSDHGKSYVVVTALGPQSSGKSLLLNRLCGTNFKVMDASQGRRKTTKGIWIAECDSNQPFIIAMDIEGTDGIEKEDDTKFDNQSALFALEIADIVLINIWCTNIGQHNGANRPLLKTIFQFMVQLFKPRKTTLLFVLRDKTQTPFDKLESLLKQDIQKEQFNAEVAALRQRFLSVTSLGQLVAANRRAASISDFSNNAQEAWNLITQIKDLHTPSIQVMFSSYRCNEIIERKLDSLSDAKLQSEIREAIQAGPKNFAERLVSILKTCLSEYDEETKDLDKGIRTARREYLKSKVLELFHPMYSDMLNRLFEKAINTFTTSLEQSLNEGKNFAESVDTLSESCVLEFDRECADAEIAEAKWGDASTIRKTLQRCTRVLAPLIDEKIRAERSQVFGEMLKLASSVASIASAFLNNRNCSLG